MSETKKQYIDYCKSRLEDFKSYLTKKKGFIFDNTNNLKDEKKISYLNMGFIALPNKEKKVNGWEFHTFYGQIPYFSLKVYFPIIIYSSQDLEFIKEIGLNYLIYRIEYAMAVICKLNWLEEFINAYEADNDSDDLYSANHSTFLEKFICETGLLVKQERLENWRAL